MELAWHGDEGLPPIISWSAKLAAVTKGEQEDKRIELPLKHLVEGSRLSADGLTPVFSSRRNSLSGLGQIAPADCQ
jgi:hypothetical protein